MENIIPFNPKIISKTRTAGDGMESEGNVVDSSLKIKRKHSSIPTQRLIQVYATNTYKNEKKTQVHSKSPKFVPYEPYPAAVKPIVPETLYKGSKRLSKNNMDINTLISQMSLMDTKMNEFKPRAKLPSASVKTKAASNPGPEMVEIQKKNSHLIEENEYLKQQLKQQVQVNKELKTMLVASMGEDLETQVQSLNEDKKHLADALLNSAQHLSTHQEQTEWLAGQCEVWRSKFLASSLMVEELAHWKKVLSERTDELQQAVKQLLDERCRARDMMLCTYRNLYSLHEKWLENIAMAEYDEKKYSQQIGNLHLTTSIPHSSNVLDMASVNLKLSENISSSVEKQDISQVNALCSVTEAEKNAENIMALPLEMKRSNEAPVNALVHHAYSSSGTNIRPIASCAHCNGKVQLL